MGTFPFVVIAKLSDSEERLRQEQNIQSTDKWCSTLIFTVYSENKLVDLNIDAHWQDIGTLYKIYLQHLLAPKYFALLEHYSMNIILKDCPLGFQFNKRDKTCLCKKLLGISNSGYQQHLNTIIFFILLE